MLGGHDDDIGFRCILESVIRDDLHPPGSADSFGALCDGIKVKRMQLFVGWTLRMQHDVAKTSHGPAKSIITAPSAMATAT